MLASQAPYCPRETLIRRHHTQQIVGIGMRQIHHLPFMCEQPPFVCEQFAQYNGEHCLEFRGDVEQSAVSSYVTFLRYLDVGCTFLLPRRWFRVTHPQH